MFFINAALKKVKTSFNFFQSSKKIAPHWVLFVYKNIFIPGRTPQDLVYKIKLAPQDFIFIN